MCPMSPEAVRARESLHMTAACLSHLSCQAGIVHIMFHGSAILRCAACQHAAAGLSSSKQNIDCPLPMMYLIL